MEEVIDQSWISCDPCMMPTKKITIHCKPEIGTLAVGTQLMQGINATEPSLQAMVQWHVSMDSLYAAPTR
jgi:hypothetical protein